MAITKSPKEIRSKFSSIVNFKELGFNHSILPRNNDLFAVTEIMDFHDQELDDGDKDCWNRISQGMGHKNGKYWSATFRIYNALHYVTRSGMNVLDVGCDIASLRDMIHKGNYHSDTNYVGVDIKIEPMQIASNRMIKTNNPAIFIQQDLYQGLPFIKENSIDILYCMETLEHLEEKPGIALLEEIKRVSNPEGLIFLSIPNHNENYWYVEKKHRHGGYPFHHKEYTVKEFKSVLKKVNLRLEDYYGWIGDRKILMANMSGDDKEIYQRLIKIMGTQIPTQIMGQLYPELAGGVVYILKKRK